MSAASGASADFDDRVLDVALGEVTPRLIDRDDRAGLVEDRDVRGQRVQSGLQERL